ncbi:O-antigen ligase family protein [Daejeonella lutea]|uniref:O-antigen ligase like membrane protein n=1 Tax=Daejeonella lutea TaxID=572036 RepID=A0A1T5EER6_9SPHI|nr:O-antigen ligase family protein [Daejeonella lutea]SKB82443.1 O-antigen ligase like membrane protein [Daejeonella lutea]
MKNNRLLTLIIVLLTVSIGAGYLIYQGGVKTSALILVGTVAIPLIYGVIAHPKVGILVMLIAAYLIMWIMRMGLTSFPLGTLMDGLLALLILGLFIKQKYNPDWTILKGPISTLILIWIGYNFLEIINPSSTSRMAWMYTIRSVAIVMLSYFIFSYHIRSRDFLKLIIKVWLSLSMFAALYGFKQHHFGFFQFEEEYLNSDPLIMNLLFIGGVWRKFSIFSDPVAFSYNMVVSSLLCVGLMFGPVSRAKKWILGFMIAFFLLNMIYSGTRGAYVLFPAAMILLSILVFNKKVLMLTALGGIIVLILINIPTSNPALFRFQSAFKPSEDASFNVRAINQKMIQPYIQSHPMGGGLGSTGVWGQKFSPGSFLASFPPDSGYVRVAVELGWIGLLIFCTLIFVILKTGINNYYKIKDPELKSYCLAMTLIVFALNVGNYPQEALVQFPTNVYFYLVVALINVTLRLDQENNHLLNA